MGRRRILGLILSETVGSLGGLFVMKIISFCLLLFLGPVVGSAAISVNFYSGTENLPQTVLADQIDLAEATGLSAGYARIDNLAHSAFGGDSTIGFMRFRYGEECDYFYRSANRDDEDPAFSGFNAIETWQYVYWQGNGALVDGAEWGTDNYILMQDAENTVVAVLRSTSTNSSGRPP